MDGKISKEYNPCNNYEIWNGTGEGTGYELRDLAHDLENMLNTMFSNYQKPKTTTSWKGSASDVALGSAKWVLKKAKWGSEIGDLRNGSTSGMMADPKIQSMMARWGFVTGFGLGREGQGMTDPLSPHRNEFRFGLGYKPTAED
ncbi:hypothetical protein RJ639_028461 [Escallonia herrerae]|uniref:G-patch domain-containing protein n=1 Tax=Escallonia herrerae TaxID=1293975 RepID=A0AA88X7Y8_9ASTE|nr:hypothetical protein RJ639_028461 [Escallonia herrerae]